MLVACLVVGVFAGSFAIARLTPGPSTTDPGPIRPSESAQPTPTVAQAGPPATALPLREWFSGPAAPIDDVLVEAGSVRWLRLAGARLTDEALASPGSDLLWRGARGGTICLCWQPLATASGDPGTLELVRLDHDLRERSRATVAVMNAPDLAGQPNGLVQAALEPSPDGRFAYLARAIRSATQWQVGLDVIDLESATIVDRVDLISVPQAERSEVRAIERPTVRIAPDGRHLLVMAASPSSEAPSSARHAWVLSLDGPTLGRVVVAGGISTAATADCAWIDFVAPANIVSGCRDSTSDPSTSFEIRRYDLEGQDLGPALGDLPAPGLDQATLDVTNGIAYAWDPIDHTLLAVDLVRGTWRSAGAPPADRENPGVIQTEGERPPPGPWITWSSGRSATDTPRERTLIGSPDGRHLFAIGNGPNPDSTSGVWVFATQTLQLAERWPALAAYSSVTLLEDGRWLAAVGRSGVTASGGPADWGTSVTVHDTTTGRPILRIGDLHTGDAVTFPGPRHDAATP